MTQEQAHWRKLLRVKNWKCNHDRIIQTSGLQRISQSCNWRSNLTTWLVIGGVIVVSPHAVIAQRIPIADDTLGNKRSLVSPNQVINGLPSNRIDGGAQRGANLFHSFREFNVDSGRGVYFTNPTGIANILTRVTGGNSSEILGTLGTLGNANLFLINPNGILFGPNARLDIRGSFLVSTANSFKFHDGSEFSATTPQAPPLLTINLPLGLQTGAMTAGSTIANRGTLTTGQNLILEGDRLDLQGQQVAGRDLTLRATQTVTARDSLTVPFVASAGGNLLVQGNQGIDIAALSHPNSGLFAGGNLVLRSDQAVGGDAHFYAGGNFQVERLNGNPGNLLSPHDPIILTNGDVTLGNYTGASLHILAGGSVTLGNVEITGTGDATTTINPTNTALFNGTQTYADLASFNLTNYQATLNRDGSVRSVDPVAVPIAIDGSTQATLDVRAGVDWAALGGLPTSPVRVGNDAPVPTATGTATSADIIVNGNIRVAQPAGLVLLTNQFHPNTLPGTISIQGTVDTSTTNTGANGGDIRLYGRGNIAVVSADPSNPVHLDSSSRSTSGNAGNGGDISLVTNSGNISLTNLTPPLFFAYNLGVNSSSFSSSGNAGNGGAISLLTNSGNISLTNLTLDSFSPAGFGTTKNGGTISLLTNSGNISLTNLVGLRSFSSSGNGGDISLVTNSGNISLTNSYLGSSSFSLRGDGTNGGAISLSTNSGNISLTSSSLDSYSSSNSILGTAGNGGAISLSTNSGSIFLTSSSFDSYSFSELGTAGNGGVIRLSAKSGNISGRSTLLNSFAVSQTGRSGNGGKVTLAADREISGLEMITVASGGNSGDVELNGFGDLRVANTRILTAQQVEVSLFGGVGVPFTVNLGDRGQAGNVMVASTGSLTFSNSAIESDTRSGNPAGDITVRANQGITLADGSTISARTISSGKAGNITLNAPSLTIAEQASITATATATATNQGGGNITLNASNLNLAGIVGVFAETQGQAPAGTLRLNPYSNQPDLAIALTLNSKISASTSNRGNGGDLIVTAPQSITIAGPGRLAVETSSTGNAGNINFTTQQLTLKDGVELSASTSNSGNAGNIRVMAERFDLLTGARISTTTAGSGTAGNITVQVGDRLFLTGRGTGLFASTTPGSTGAGGNINLDSRFVQIQDGAAIAVNSQGSGTGGNIFLQANRLESRNQGSITAETASAQGGNITLNVRDLLLLRNNSLISTTAGTAQAGGDGGNISFNGGFIVAVPSENSDITANAFTGRGGNVNIAAQGLFGIQFRPRLTPLSDITASSEFGIAGVVDINTLNVDPNRGLVVLPTEPRTPQVAEGCQTTGSRTASRFVVTGRGGLPENPREALSSDDVQVGLVTLSGKAEGGRMKGEGTQRSKARDEGQVIEATGWIVDRDGTVVMVAERSASAPARFWQPKPDCQN